MAGILDVEKPGIYLEWGAPWKDTKELAGFFEQLPDEVIEDLRPVWEEVFPVVRKSLKKTFAVQGRPRWKPLSDKYLTEKLRKGFPRRILYRTGRMYRGIAKEGSPDNIYINEKDMMAWGIDPYNFPGRYPIVHDLGSRSGRIPQREFMRLYPEDVKEIVQKAWKVLHGKIEDYLHRKGLQRKR